MAKVRRSYVLITVISSLLLGIPAIVPVVRSQNGYVGALDYLLMLVIVAVIASVVFIAGLVTRKEEIGLCLLLAALLFPTGFCGSAFISKQVEIGAYRQDPKIPFQLADHPSTITGTTCPIKEGELFFLNGKVAFDDCDLKRNAKILNGKLVRIKSTYWLTRPHGSILLSSSCDQTSSTVEPVSLTFRTSNDEDFIINELKANPADIEAIGRFYVTVPTRKSDSIADNSRYHFELVCLEKANPSKGENIEGTH